MVIGRCHLSRRGRAGGGRGPVVAVARIGGGGWCGSGRPLKQAIDERTIGGHVCVMLVGACCVIRPGRVECATPKDLPVWGQWDVAWRARPCDAGGGVLGDPPRTRGMRDIEGPARVGSVGRRLGGSLCGGRGGADPMWGTARRPFGGARRSLHAVPD